MSILNYLSRKNTLLNPNGSLSSRVNHEIELVQSAVVHIVPKSASEIFKGITYVRMC